MPALTRLTPLLFVLLWSTGFIGAKYGLPYAEPLTFLVSRYVLVIGLMSLLALAMRAPWPASPREALHIGVTGLLVQALYLGGVFMSIHRGLPAGISALVVGMQPLLTAALAGALLGERVSARQYLFAQQGAGAQCGEQRLQADHQGGDPRRQAVADGGEHAAQIDRMDEHPGERDVEPLARVFRPRRTGGQGQHAHQGDHQHVAGAQEAEGLGVGQAVLGADEAGAPQEHEQQWKEAGQQRAHRALLG